MGCLSDKRVLNCHQHPTVIGTSACNYCYFVFLLNCYVLLLCPHYVILIFILIRIILTSYPLYLYHTSNLYIYIFITSVIGMLLVIVSDCVEYLGGILARCVFWKRCSVL